MEKSTVRMIAADGWRTKERWQKEFSDAAAAMAEADSICLAAGVACVVRPGGDGAIHIDIEGR